MKKFFLTIAILALTLAVASGCDGGGNPSDSGVTVIRALQSGDHLSLDLAREGFVAGLAEEGWVEGEDGNLDFQWFSAGGDMSVANAMAQQIVDDNPDLILGIATTTSQFLAQTTESIPIVITAVTDPLRADLVESLERPGRNVTGTSDLSPVEEQFNLIVRLFPDAQTIGIIYNPGEINSQVLAEMAESAAHSRGLGFERVPISAPADAAQATEFIVSQVDVLYTPACNTVAQSIAVIAATAEESNVPILGGNENHVRNGALATFGVNYYRLGRQASLMAATILRDEDTPANMPIQWQSEHNLVINTAAAQRLNIPISPEILSEADVIVEE